jgi:putative ABC transport system permease protein
MLRDLFFRARSLFQRKTVERELDDELRFHLERQAEKHVASGMARREALRRARLEFGGHEQVKEECREARGVGFLETTSQDVRYAFRILGRTPVVTAVAILSLAWGIGANTAIFSLIDAVMLRFLPVERPRELVLLEHRQPGREDLSTVFTNPLWEQVRDQQDIFSSVLAWSDGANFDLGHGGAVQHVNGVYASGRYFETLGIRQAAGRLLNTSDDQHGCPGAVVLGYGFWQEHFGGMRSAIGSTISLNHHVFPIVGVSAPGFTGLEIGRKYDVALPLCTVQIFEGPENPLVHRSWWWLKVMGRVKPGLPAEQVEARLKVISPGVMAGALPESWHKEDQDRFLQAQLAAVPAATGTSYLREQFSQPLKILMGVVGLVLLIACANIASLMLARSTVRGREIAVRKALGASRGRLVRQLLTECVLLSLAGSLLGFVFAYWGNFLLVRFISTGHERVFLEFALDWHVLGFTVAVAILTGVLFGILPALRSTRVSLTSAMKGAQADDHERRIRFRPAKWIVASQVALSLVLMVAAGLFLRSFVKLTTKDPGFDRTNLLLVGTNLKETGVPPENYLATFNAMEERLRAVPGVSSVGHSVLTPASHMIWNNEIKVDSPKAPTKEAALVYFNYVSPGYLETMRTPLLAGRGFSAGDTKTSPEVAIVNQTLARKFFGGANPVGKYFRVEEKPGKPDKSFEIVGIMHDAIYESLRDDMVSQAILPISQIPEPAESASFEVRTALRPANMISAAQEAMGAVKNTASLEFTTLAEQVDDSLIQERLLATLSGFFGALATLLAMIGLYGALSYLVAQRRTEFGIRMALGARPGSILQLVMKDVVVILLVGLAAGLALALATVGVLQKLLFGLAPRDVFTMLGAVAVLSAVAFLAGYLPARRAMRVDPMVALRYE